MPTTAHKKNNSDPDNGKPVSGNEWQEKAQKLLKANLNNLARKVIDGQALTAAEVNILKEEAGSEDPGPKHPKFVKNQTELADILGVTRRTIHNWRKLKDAPPALSDGRWCVDDWLAFKAKQDGTDDLDHGALKARQILLQNRLLEQKIELNDSLAYPADQVEKDTADLIATAKAVLLAGPSSLAPQVVGVSIPEAEKLLRDWLHSALSKLQANPLGRKEPANA